MCQYCNISFLGFAEPQAAMLDSYADALRRGWSPNNLHDVSAAELSEIETDADAFIARRRDDAPAGATVILPDGTLVERLAMRERWIWDGDFAGRIALRYQPGTSELPAHVLGHIGYAVVPWKRGHGYARKALRHMLGEAREIGLDRVDITTDADNIASQSVVLANRGWLVDTFVNPTFGPQTRHRYTIDLR